MDKSYEIKKENMCRLAEFSDKLFIEPQLKYVFFEVTDKCNLCCKHCGSQCGSNKLNFLPLPIIKKVLDDIAGKYDPKSILICLTGGEPMLYRDIYKVINYARLLDFKVGMTTNGTLINANAAFSLAQAGLNTIAVSIDGLPATHNTFRCSEGAFDKAIKGCKMLKMVGFDVQVTTVVNKANISELEDIYILLDKNEIKSWVITNVDPVGRAKDKENMLLDGSELRKMFEFIREKRYDFACEMEVTYGCAHYAGLEFEREIRDFYFQCGAGVQIASIAANGDIRACLDIERRSDLCQGSIYEDKFLDVWDNKFQIFRKNRSRLSKTCSTCTEVMYCRGDSSHTWNYDLSEPDYCIYKMIKGVNDDD